MSETKKHFENSRKIIVKKIFTKCKANKQTKNTHFLKIFKNKSVKSKISIGMKEELILNFHKFFILCKFKVISV